MSDRVVELRGVEKAFGSTRALRGLDLALDAGCILGFVGPNGAGKSTALRICVGLIQRDAGDARVVGLDPARDALAIRRRSIYLPGETSIYKQMRGREFLEFALHGYGFDREIAEVGRELFDLPLDQKIRGYSAGMKQRLALRAALCADTELYILDEPDRALDATARMQLRELLVSLRNRGRAVLLSSHHLSEVEAIADHTQFVLDGAAVEESRIDAARQSLRREVRLRVTPDTELPDGTIRVDRTPDGGYRVRVEGDPVAWLGRIPADAIVSAEIGATRLEDLYRALTEPVAGGAR